MASRRTTGAKHRRPSTRPPMRAALGGAAAGTAAVTAVALLPGMASADPRASVASVQQRLDALEHEAEVAAEDYNEATDARAEVAARLEKVKAEVAQQEAALADAQGVAGSIAAAQYRSGGVDPSLQLFLSDDPAAFLAQASSLEQVGEQQGSVIRKVAAAQNELSQDRLAVAQQLAELAELEKTLAAKQKAVEDKVAESERLLASLQEEERRRLEEARRAAAEQAEREAAAVQAAADERSDADRAGRDRSEDSGGGSDEQASADEGGSSEDDSAPSSASGRAAVAVETAMAQVGKTYRYAANGPDAFDCSGLTSYAWRAAGVSLPRSSRAQFAAGRKVSRSELQPGDLVYFYSPISHVGIYIGDGKLVHASNPRTGVKIGDIDTMPWAGATRP